MSYFRRNLLMLASKPGGGRPVVPQTGTWQFKTTPAKGLFILGKDDDTPDEAQFVRMVSGYGFKFVLNTEAENLNDNLRADTDNEYYPSGTTSQFPDGVKVVDLCKYVIQNNLGEVAQHDSSDYTIWDSSLLDDYIDGFYTTYTTGGGTKTKAELKQAILDKYASTDKQQGALRVPEQRAILENAIGSWIYTIGIWGGSPNIVIDDITVGTFQYMKRGLAPLSREMNYFADSILATYTNANVTGSFPYEVVRDSNYSASHVEDICNKLYSLRGCCEVMAHQIINQGTQAEWEAFKAYLDKIKTFVDANKIQVITRKDLYDLGEFVSNPIKAISITTDEVEYQVGTTITEANFVCKATLNDDTQVTCESDRIIDLSSVDTTTAGAYTVTMWYRGFKTTCSVTIVSSGMNLPSDVQNASDGYYQTWRFSDDTDKCYCFYLSEGTGGWTGDPTKYAGAYLWVVNSATNQTMKVFYSSDGSATWTTLYNDRALRNVKSTVSDVFGAYTFASTQNITLGEQTHIT